VRINLISSLYSTVMVGNFTNINKTNNHFWPQIIENKKDHDVWRWKSSPWLDTGTQIWRDSTG